MQLEWSWPIVAGRGLFWRHSVRWCPRSAWDSAATSTGCSGLAPFLQKNLLGIAAKAREKNPKIEILIAGMQMPDNMDPDFTARFKAVFPEAAKESKATLVPYLVEGVGGSEALNQPDGIHPTAEGQAKVAGNVWRIRPADSRTGLRSG